MTDPRFSLIVATLGRTSALERFLQSITIQDMAAQVIVVDQNEDDRLVEIVARYQDRIEVVHKRCSPGLSYARNVGLQSATGDIIAFPDDDCWYPRGLLRAVTETLASRPEVGGMTCRCADEEGRLAAGAEDRRSGYVDKANVWGRGVSATIFLRADLVHDTGVFDEDLGLGTKTPYQSSEDTDYLLRAIGKGHRIFYAPDLTVHHPAPDPHAKDPNLRKAWIYGLGAGKVLRTHHFGIGLLAQHFGMPLLGVVVALMRGRTGVAKVRYVRAVGRIQGWRRPHSTHHAAPRFTRASTVPPAAAPVPPRGDRLSVRLDERASTLSN